PPRRARLADGGEVGVFDADQHLVLVRRVCHAVTIPRQGACTRPAPTSTERAPRRRAAPAITWKRAAPETWRASAQRAAMPATCGVAMLVPESTRLRVGIGAAE